MGQSKKIKFLLIPLFALPALALLPACQGPPPPFTPASVETPTPPDVGRYAPPASITPVALATDDYVASQTGFVYLDVVYPLEASLLKNVNVFASNHTRRSGTLELAVYNQGFYPGVVADGVLTVPPGSNQWFTLPMSGAVTHVDSLFLVAHALTGGLSVGFVPSPVPEYCEGFSGNYAGTFLPEYLQPTPQSYDCYAINLNWSGVVTIQ